MVLSPPADPRPRRGRAGAMARGATAGALFLLLLLVASSANAQVPPAPDTSNPESHFLDIAVTCPNAHVLVDYAGTSYTECTIEDLGRDSVSNPGSGQGNSISNHYVELFTVPHNDTVEGYQVILGESFVPMRGGDRKSLTLQVQATPMLNAQEYGFDLVAVYHGPNDYTENQTVPFVARVNPYDFALVRVTNQVQKAGQDDVVTYEVEVQNTGVYPDTYRFTVDTDPDIKVSLPPTLYVPAGETRTTTVSLLTPKDKVYELSRSTSVIIKVNSVTGTGAYSTVGVLQIRGAYMPIYWLPLTLVGLASAGVVAQQTRERSELRRLEKGRPRRVEPTPRQQVLLKEIKRKDPEAYKKKRAALAAVYAQRRKEYREHRKERLAEERAEAREAHKEFKAAKKQRKLDHKAEKKQAKLDRKARKKEEAAQRKIDKKREKLLQKQRKKLGKKKAKLEKRQQKIDKKQAKKDAKLAKAEAKASLKADKAAAREAKRAARAEKKQRRGQN